jgi:hypothetical protein
MTRADLQEQLTGSEQEAPLMVDARGAANVLRFAAASLKMEGFAYPPRTEDAPMIDAKFGDGFFAETWALVEYVATSAGELQQRAGAGKPESFQAWALQQRGTFARECATAVAKRRPTDRETRSQVRGHSRGGDRRGAGRVKGASRRSSSRSGSSGDDSDPSEPEPSGETARRLFAHCLYCGADRPEIDAGTGRATRSDWKTCRGSKCAVGWHRSWQNYGLTRDEAERERSRQLAEAANPPLEPAAHQPYTECHCPHPLVDLDYGDCIKCGRSIPESQVKLYTHKLQPGWRTRDSGPLAARSYAGNAQQERPKRRRPRQASGAAPSLAVAA